MEKELVRAQPETIDAQGAQRPLDTQEARLREAAAALARELRSAAATVEAQAMESAVAAGLLEGGLPADARGRGPGFAAAELSRLAMSAPAEEGSAQQIRDYGATPPSSLLRPFTPGRRTNGSHRAGHLRAAGDGRAIREAGQQYG